jgi:hypothetical protein
LEKNLTKKELVEWHKMETLISNLSTEKKKKKPTNPKNPKRWKLNLTMVFRVGAFRK